jgi:membrane associated rhomboid family serine protease
MSLDRRYRSSASLLFPSFPPGTKWLIISNVAVYLIYFFGSLMSERPLFLSLNLMPYAVVHSFAIWQLVTYMFLHGGVWHILFNMLALWMFGAAVETTWGTRRFLEFYFICGVGAGVCVVLAWRLAIPTSASSAHPAPSMGSFSPSVCCFRTRKSSSCSCSR